MRNIIKIENSEVKEAVKELLSSAGELADYQSVYNKVFSLDNLRLKEQSYGYVIAGNNSNRREYEVLVSECNLRNFGYNTSKYQIHLRKSSQNQNDLEEQKAIEEWLKSKGV